MKAVSNAGPLMALGKLGLVSLFHALYNSVLIPTAVYEEVVTRGLEQNQSDAYAVQLAIARNEIGVIDVPPETISEVIRTWPHTDVNCCHCQKWKLCSNPSSTGMIFG